MKQTNPSSALRMTVSLGILGLNEGFVQLNEVMTSLFPNVKKINKIIVTLK